MALFWFEFAEKENSIEVKKHKELKKKKFGVMENGNKAKKQVTSSASSGNEKVRLHPTELITLEHPNDHNCLLHSAKGFAIGFLFAAVPSTLKSRKISTQYAFGLSALIGLFRCSNCLIHRLKQLLTQAKNPLNQFITPRLNVFISSV